MSYLCRLTEVTPHDIDELHWIDYDKSDVPITTISDGSREILRLKFHYDNHAALTMQLKKLSKPPYDSRKFDALELEDVYEFDADEQIFLCLSGLRDQLHPKKLLISFFKTSTRQLLLLDRISSEAEWPLTDLALHCYCFQHIDSETAFLRRFSSLDIWWCSHDSFPTSDVGFSRLRFLSIKGTYLADMFLWLASPFGGQTSSIERLNLRNLDAPDWGDLNFQRYEKLKLALSRCTSLKCFEATFSTRESIRFDILRFLPPSVKVITLQLPSTALSASRLTTVQHVWRACVSHPGWLPCLESFMIVKRSWQPDDNSGWQDQLEALADLARACRPGITVDVDIR